MWGLHLHYSASGLYKSRTGTIRKILFYPKVFCSYVTRLFTAGNAIAMNFDETIFFTLCVELPCGNMSTAQKNPCCSLMRGHSEEVQHLRRRQHTPTELLLLWFVHNVSCST